MREHHVTCQEIVELVTDYLEHALDSETAAAFEEHINFCDGCEAYLGQDAHRDRDRRQRSSPRTSRPRRSGLLMSAFREWKRA